MLQEKKIDPFYFCDIICNKHVAHHDDKIIIVFEDRESQTGSELSRFDIHAFLSMEASMFFYFSLLCLCAENYMNCFLPQQLILV